MTIGPVDSFPPAKSVQAANTSVGSGRAQASPESGAVQEAAQPVSGTLPKQESSVAKNVASTYELPQDEVEVHQDPETKDQIIIQYLDQAKTVVLQVPSNEELLVERGIAREFQPAAKLRQSASTAAVGSVGEKTHGD
ncbi:MAG: hypothetical protein ABSF66_06220 [Terriglobales bacterium]|jgi:hypothetical protein